MNDYAAAPGTGNFLTYPFANLVDESSGNTQG